MKPAKLSLRFLLFVALIVSLVSSSIPSILQQNCPSRPIPQKFGILTTTFIRNKSTKMINDYLRRYAESDCDVYENIYIVWNNEETPEEMGVLQNLDKWKKNVYFMQTIENSLDFKYIVPTWASQKVFFAMDDDFDISCQTFKSAFSSWQKSSYGQVGPLASFYARSFVFDPKSQSFSYIDQIKLNPKWDYYHFGLTGIAFISRHFFDMYYSDIAQLKEMRKMVVSKNNCEDLLLNFMVGYLYPQLVTEYLNVTFKSLGTTGVSTTKTHKEYRAQCITHFTQILGFNPVRYVEARKNQTLMNRKTPLNEDCLVNLKQQHFEKNFINNRAYYMYIKRITGTVNHFITGQNQKLIQAKKDIEAFMKKRKQQISQLRNQQKPQVNLQPGLNEKERKMLQQTEMQIHFGTQEQIQSYMNKNAKPTIQQSPNQSPNQSPDQSPGQVMKTEKTQQPPSQTPQKSLPAQQQHLPEQTPSRQMQYQLYLIILASVILSILCIKKIIDSRKSKYHTIPESFSTQI